MKVRTRFAPSPTGFLHIGGLRTALFAYLTAKSQGGDFVLRIEDTDEKRRVKDADKKLVEILAWSGLDIDESPQKPGQYGPYVQSERQEIYDKYKNILLESGQAYPCFCSAQRLEEMRRKQQAEKLPPRYDRCCRDLSPEETARRIAAGDPYVIRQKMPLEGEVRVKDEIRGEITVKSKELDDHVLIKSNGVPTYHFASVVDDHLMEISHVTRAEEWIPSFPKNILLYQAFGWTPPKFIHLPVVLNKEGGGKLSKRQGDVAVEDFRAKGYLPGALINFCALLGWSPYTEKNKGKGQDGKNLEILDLQEIVKRFKPEGISTSPAVFDVEKLDFFNAYYIRQLPIGELTDKCQPFLEENFRLGQDRRKQERKFLEGVVGLEQERLKKLSDITERSVFMFADSLSYDPELLVWKKMDRSEVGPRLSEIKDLFEKVSEENWSKDLVEKNLMSHIESIGGKIGEYLWPLRVSLSGQAASPGPFDIAGVLGKKEVMQRINSAIKKLAE